jgi:3-hydroxybutyryl-CoA dehydrogenase
MNRNPVIGVVGLGTMGLGIAQVFAQAGFSVLATDATPETRDSARARLAAALDGRIAHGRLTREAAAALLDRLEIVARPEAMAPAGLVIEAIIEALAPKQALFAALESVLAPDAVLATNTSSLSVAAIAAPLAWPARVLGLHFFNPAPAMKLVELVTLPATSPDAATLARDVTEAAGKTVIAAPDCPGFIVNRCARPFYGEALALLEEGRSASDIDAAMLAAGYRLGPFALIDLIGADVNLAATEGLASAMQGNPRYHVFDSLRAQVARGDLGRKTGRGFLHPSAPGAAPADAAAIALRIEATLVNEAASLLADGGTDAEGIDMAMMLGLNFPRGPFAAARAQGFDRIRATLHALEAQAPSRLRGRYLVSEPLKTMQ